MDGVHSHRDRPYPGCPAGLNWVSNPRSSASRAARLPLHDDPVHTRRVAGILPRLKIPMDNPTTPTPPADTPQPSPTTTPVAPPTPGEWHKPAARIISIAVIVGAVAMVFWVWNVVEHHPRTDDATARANVVGIAPRARGQIIKLNVVDNQAVNTGDVLFEIDPADYALALEKARSALAALDQQIEVARAQDTQLKLQVKVAEAGVERAKAELKQAGDTLQRMQPLLANGFAKADDVDRAATAKQVATAALAAAEQQLSQARTALSTLASL